MIFYNVSISRFGVFKLTNFIAYIIDVMVSNNFKNRIKCSISVPNSMKSRNASFAFFIQVF